MTPAAMLEQLGAWRSASLLRPLDLAFAAFVAEIDPLAPPSLLLAAALLAQLEGRGHSCLPLDAFAGDPNAILGWPADPLAELEDLLAACPLDAATARSAWAGSAVVRIDPVADIGGSPLVLVADRLYLRRYWRHESRLAAQIRARTRAVPRAAGDPPASGVDVESARELLDRLFASPTSTAPPDWQRVACALALRGGLTLVTGGPGTGKTYTAARLIVLLQALHAGPQPLRVALAAPTGKAAARLRQSIDLALAELRPALGDTLPLDDWASQIGPARTLHALLGARPGTRRLARDAANPLDLDLLVVDEASMVHLEMMAALLDALPAGARLILLGDKDQLASVEAGAVLGDLCQGPGETEAPQGYRPATARWVQAISGQTLPAAETGSGPDLAQQTVRLRRSRRFEGPIGRLAEALNRGDAPAALALLREAPDGVVSMVTAPDAGAIPPLAVEGREGAPGGYRAYLEALARRPASAQDFDAWARGVLGHFDGFRVLCAVREGPWGVTALNAAIERALVHRGLLPGRGEWYEGRPVMITRNEPDLGVFNGDIGVVLRPAGGAGALRVHFLQGESLRSVSVGRLAALETAFAMTVHKCQGSEFEHVLLVLPEQDAPVLTRELVYTGITRARRALTLVTRHPEQLASAAGRRTRRWSGLAAALVDDD